MLGHFLSTDDHAAYDKVYDEGVRALPPPRETYDLKTAYGTVRGYRFGDDGGDPVVLLHGRGATSVMWLPNLAPLASRRVHVIDLLGEGGRSEQTAPIRDAADQAAWLAEVLARIGPAHLVGVSIGGWLAVNQAVRRPENVLSVTALDPAATFAGIPLGLALRTIPIVVPVLKEWALPRFLAYIDGQGGPVPEDDPVARVISANLRWYRASLPAPRPFTDDELRRITLPVLAVIAGRSVIHDPRKAYERARALIPGARVELWPEATHSIAGQFADRVGARVLTFLDGLA